ncbi:amino acid ABC transporter permease [Roseiarcaceae bacterium H3SJ34-1]|uniref:amino acid ABC transporter permease n=1 Tax=Terripilifer ovatus TaxID=3032367 RepID=UPI003AB96A67|nr:amino acid ABC transporter permease [Roseiarcaceae bacterium H3SJ34-1]
MASTDDLPGPRTSILNNPLWRGLFWQGLTLALLVWLALQAFDNAVVNMRARNIPTDFSFWNRPAGFDVNQTLIPFSASTSTYGQAFFVGLLNTLLVAAIGIVFSTIIGFTVGIGRLSNNWIVARLATVYVEVVRNTPLLLQLLFWYNAVLKALPGPRESLALPGSIYLNNRGLVLPEPVVGAGFEWALGAVALALLLAILFAIWARVEQRRTGARHHALPVAIGLLLVLGGGAWLASGNPLSFQQPVLRGFNFAGGIKVIPELVALIAGLSLYTASFIAEVVRAGVSAVPGGQTEAAQALGLRRGDILRLVVVPQALRIIIPPLTNQYLNLLKNSSLAVFIGYPDLIQIFAGTVLNQTGAAVQVVSITMAVYLAISLVTSLAMNLYARRIALHER